MNGNGNGPPRVGPKLPNEVWSESEQESAKKPTAAPQPSNKVVPALPAKAAGLPNFGPSGAQVPTRAATVPPATAAAPKVDGLKVDVRKEPTLNAASPPPAASLPPATTSPTSPKSPSSPNAALPLVTNAAAPSATPKTPFLAFGAAPQKTNSTGGAPNGGAANPANAGGALPTKKETDMARMGYSRSIEDDIVLMEFKARVVYFSRGVEADLFEKLLRRDESKNMLKTLKEYVLTDSADAIVKLAFRSPSCDFVLKYSAQLSPEKVKVRRQFEKALLTQRVFMDHELSADKEFYYVKLYTSFERLAKEAAAMKMKFPLTATTEGTSFFRRDKLKLFQGGNKPMEEVQLNFFTSTQRIYLTHNIVSNIRLKNYKKRKNAGIQDLLYDRVFTAFYPLHDGPWDDVQKQGSNRQLLKEKWARGWLRKQPLDMIRDYMGEKVAFYFAFFGFYTKHLAYASVLGILTFVYGLYTQGWTNSTISFEFLSKTFDNELTVVFALVMSGWSTIVMELWKRKRTTLAYRWNSLNYDKEERARPQWVSGAIRKSPVTGKWERYQSGWKYKLRLLLSGMVVIVCIAITVSSVTANMLFKPWIKSTYPEFAWLSTYGSSVISLISIIIWGTLYSYINVWLTLFENHQTETAFEDAFIAKKFVFDCINSYSSLYYIGIVKTTLNSGIISDSLWIDSCNYDSCMVELMIQLAIIMVGQNVNAQVNGVLLPRLKSFIRQKKAAFYNKRREQKARRIAKKQGIREMTVKERPPKEQWELDEHLVRIETLSYQYSAIVIQFGYVLFFVSCFPLGPVIAWLNNFVQIRFNATSMLRNRQRPIPQRSNGIGRWNEIFVGMSYFAVISNAALIAFSSENFKNTWLALYKDDPWKLLIARIAFVMIYEHVVFGIKYLISMAVPDMTTSVRVSIAKEQYQANIILDGQAEAEDEEEALYILKTSKMRRRKTTGAEAIGGQDGEWF